MVGSIAKTAQKYTVPASSVSISIKRLEQELGVELFVRTSNRIALSEKGKEFLASISNILSQLDVSVNSLSGGSAQKQTLSILARYTRETLVHWIVRFHRMYPAVSFKLTFEDTPENYGKYDIIISLPEKQLEGYESFRWRKFGIWVEALDTDPLCRGNVTLSQLRDRQFVTTSTQRGGFKAFTQACEEQGFTPKLFLECDDYECRNVAMRSGTCLGLNLRNSAEERQSNMQFLNVSDFKEELLINVYYKKERYDGNIKQFLDLLKTSTARP